MIEWNDFAKVDMRIGTVIEAEPFLEARKPAIKLKIDLGTEIGVKQSSAQITKRYEPEQLIGKQVVAVVNFPPMRIAGYKSEVLVLGGMVSEDEVILLQTDENVPNGTKVGWKLYSHINGLWKKISKIITIYDKIFV